MPSPSASYAEVLRVPLRWWAVAVMFHASALLAFLALEYAFRRWHLRHIEHVSLPVFLTRLVRRWPALARSVMSDRERSGA